ncbi:MAG: hypothetical protein ACYCPN_04955 [Thermoplasmata archaeon]
MTVDVVEEMIWSVLPTVAAARRLDPRTRQRSPAETRARHPPPGRAFRSGERYATGSPIVSPTRAS